MKKLTLQEIKDTLVGCTILGTGGGGSLESGLEAVEKAWNARHEFKLLSFDEINDDSYYANPYYCGSIVPKGDTSQKRGDEIATSVKALEEYMGVQFEGLVSIEYGGGNTGAVMAAAARTGKYIVDADAAGRAVPELQFSTYYVTENPITPFSVGTSFGDMAIVTNVENDARAEALSRYMAIGSGGLVGMTDHPIKGDKLRHAVIPNALTYAATVGRAQREAVERGSDPIQAILDTGKGKLLFQGTVTGESEWGIKEGFTVGTIHIAGEGAFAHQTSKIWYKNENMVMWIDDKVNLTCPDLICVVEKATGYPITNPNCVEGMEVAVLGFHCHELWTRERALEMPKPPATSIMKAMLPIMRIPSLKRSSISFHLTAPEKNMITRPASAATARDCVLNSTAVTTRTAAIEIQWRSSSLVDSTALYALRSTSTFLYSRGLR